jgi:hypothetical protein
MRISKNHGLQLLRQVGENTLSSSAWQGNNSASLERKCLALGFVEHYLFRSSTLSNDELAML